MKQQSNNEIFLDGQILISQLTELGQIGADSVNGGRTRAALTDDERLGRDLR